MSILGNILRITFFPFKEESVRSLKSFLVSVKSGAAEPLAGRSPEVFAGVPFSVTCDMCLIF